MDRHQVYFECIEFLNREAELLDDINLQEWLDLLTEDIEYLVPRRVTRERGSGRSEFSEEGFLYRDDYGTLSTRVKRFENEYAWAENPPTRTRRFVSNVRPEPLSAEDDDVMVKSNLMLYRDQGDTTAYDLIVGEREDRLRRIDGELKLSKRTVFLDQTVLNTQNLSFFL
jgi:3-phenylpropionate/cinnamic acid dioxygenase small subunit